MPVDYALRDAHSVKRYLLSLGFAESHIFYRENATRNDFIALFGDSEHLGDIHTYAEAEDEEVFIFISGHGVPDTDSKAYFLPHDGLVNNLKNTAYSRQLLMEQIAKIGAGKRTVVLDVCFSGTTGGAKANQGTSITLVPSIDPDYLAKTVIYSATGVKEYASWHDEGEHGLFTYYFLKALHQGNADIDKNGALSYSEIYKYIYPQVEQGALEQGGRKQHPQMTGGGDKNRILFSYQK